MGHRKREEVVLEATRRETKRGEVELKRVGSLVMKDERHREE